MGGRGIPSKKKSSERQALVRPFPPPLCKVALHCGGPSCMFPKRCRHDTKEEGRAGGRGRGIAGILLPPCLPPVGAHSMQSALPREEACLLMET